MSYCSDVALVLKAKILERFNQFLIESDNELQEVNTFLQECKQRLISENGDVLYFWKYKEWQQNYLPVFVIERFMNHLDNENISENYLFIRMGEEWDDVEYRGEFGSPYGGENVFYLEAVREIVFCNKSSDSL